MLMVLLWVVACQPQSPEAPPPVADVPSSEPVSLLGTGATFPLFLYQRWFSDYSRQHPEVQVNYQPTGSAVGIQQVIAGTTDFGASDIPMTDQEMAQVEQGVVLLPMTAGSVAIVYNLPGVESGLRLPRSVYPKIFLGEITNWADPQIAAANPEVTLPDLAITVVHRADGSGTTATLTEHLSAVDAQWRETVGAGLSVNWPTGVGIKSNAGVSAQVQQAEGTLGYVEYSYAKQLAMPVAALENKAGDYVVPSAESAAVVVNNAAMPDDLRIALPDPEMAGAYPIVTYSWILAFQRYADAAKATALRQVLTWSLTEGQAVSEELGYVPLSESVTQQVMAALETIRAD